MFGTVFINCHIIHDVIFAVPGFQFKCESCTFFVCPGKTILHTSSQLLQESCKNPAFKISYLAHKTLYFLQGL